MWVIDYFVRANQMIREQETERLRLVSGARRQAGDARGWRWRIEPGMEEAFEHLQDWLLPTEREAAAETAALVEGPARPEEGARVGAPHQSPMPVGWSVPACCGVACCAP